MQTRSTIVVMGVAGCGKSTVGTLLADRLAVPYVEADAFHPPANVAKMSRGAPLTDDDRWPWLAALAGRIAAGGGVVVSCSALKRRYRDVLRAADPHTLFVHLVVDRGVAAARVSGRSAHFMPASLVDSQFDALEPLQPDEAGTEIDATCAPTAIVTDVLAGLPAPPSHGRPEPCSSPTGAPSGARPRTACGSPSARP